MAFRHEVLHIRRQQQCLIDIPGAKILAHSPRLNQTRSELNSDYSDRLLVQLHAGALVVGADPFLSGRREQLVALASRHAVPAIYAWREFAASGGLISYGARLTSAFHLLGTYAGKVLKGANPAEVPVQQATKF